MEELEAKLSGPPRPSLEDLNAVLASVELREEPWAKYIKGRVLFMLQRDQDAFECLEEAGRLDGTLCEALFYGGLVLRYLERGDEACEYLQRALDASSEKPETLRNKYAHALANALMASQKPEQALVVYRQAVELQATFGSLSALGACLLQFNENEGAVVLQQALDSVEEKEGFNDEHMNCLFNLGSILMKRQQFADALPKFEAAQSITPQDGAVVAKVIQCHSALGNAEARDEAIHRLRGLRKQGLVRDAKFCREQIMTEKGNILCYEFFEFSGEFGRPFYMLVWEHPSETRDPLPKYTSMGSYDATNEVSAEAGAGEDGVPEGHRMWHMDAYYTGGRHSTLGFLRGLCPSFDEVKARLLEGMLGGGEALSSFAPG